MGFEPTRAEHIGLAVQRLNHSATSSSQCNHVFFLTCFIPTTLSRLQGVIFRSQWHKRYFRHCQGFCREDGVKNSCQAQLSLRTGKEVAVRTYSSQSSVRLFSTILIPQSPTECKAVRLLSMARAFGCVGQHGLLSEKLKQPPSQSLYTTLVYISAF